MTMVYLQELLNSIIQSTYSDLVYKSEEKNSHMAYSLSLKESRGGSRISKGGVPIPFISTYWILAIAGLG